jgi:hypothetical protein
MTHQPTVDLPPEVANLKGSGPRGAITQADIARARGITSAAGPGRRLTPVLVPVPFPYGRGPVTQVDLFDLNPLVTIVRTSSLPSPYGGPAPTMFSAGDLPLFTASGVDPTILRFVPWSHRHSAATTGDIGVVFAMVEDAEELPADVRGRLQNRAGVEAFERYKASVWRWAVAPPPQPPNPAGKRVSPDDDRDVFNQRFGNP